MSENNTQRKWDIVYQLIRFKPNVKSLVILKTDRGYLLQMRNDKQSTYILPTAEELAYLSILFERLSIEQAHNKNDKNLEN